MDDDDSWIVMLHSNGIGYNNNVATDLLNNVIVTGIYSGVMDFDPSHEIVSLPISRNEPGDGFVSKYDSLGGFNWVRRVEANTWYPVKGITCDSLNNIYIIGIYDSILSIEDENQNSLYRIEGSSGAFLLKIDQNGQVQWCDTWDWKAGTKFFKVGPPNLFLVAIQPNGDILTIGECGKIREYNLNGQVINEQILDYYPISVINGENGNIILLDTRRHVIKLDPNLNEIWSMQIANCKIVRVNDNENIWVLGEDFITILNKDGEIIDEFKFENIQIMDIVFNSCNEAYISGFYLGIPNFNTNGYIVNEDQEGWFVIKVNDDGRVINGQYQEAETISQGYVNIVNIECEGVYIISRIKDGIIWEEFKQIVDKEIENFGTWPNLFILKNLNL